MWASKFRKKQTGFTIIETMIVLAIASLIMLIVFLAVPALKRNADNTNRTADASKIASGVNECLSDNNNVVGNCGNNAAVLGVTLDTSTLRILTSVSIGSDAPASIGFPSSGTTNTAYVYFGYACNTAGTNYAASTSTSFVVLYRAASTTSAGAVRCVSS